MVILPFWKMSNDQVLFLGLTTTATLRLELKPFVCLEFLEASMHRCEIFALRKNLVPPGFVLSECDSWAIPDIRV
jgi:hypothetical protein